MCIPMETVKVERTKKKLSSLSSFDYLPFIALSFHIFKNRKAIISLYKRAIPFKSYIVQTKFKTKFCL